MEEGHVMRILDSKEEVDIRAISKSSCPSLENFIGERRVE
jgi:hypothetical protein